MASIKRINVQLFDIYKKLHGDLLIPSKFVISNLPDWPQEAHGMKLGNYTNRVREDVRNQKNEYLQKDVKHLLNLGFEINLEYFHSKEIVRALQTYKNLHNSIDIDTKFKIPATDEWPKTLWNRNLSNIITRLRENQKEHQVIRPELEAMGFDLSPLALPRHKDFGLVFRALSAYKEQHHNVRVNLKFEVPFDDSRYPEESWGLKLGKIVFSIRSETLFSDRREQLTALGVEYETQQAPPPFKRIYSAIKAYGSFNGNVDVPQSFVVPHGSAYPHNTWGIKLGHIVNSMRTQGTYKQHSAELKAVGIDYEAKLESDFAQKLAALQAYKKEHGHLLVPRNFAIQHGDPNYPPETWGLKLGNSVKRIRYKNYYSKHRDQLEALGFVYKGGVAGEENERFGNKIVEMID